ncbi:uncharacterized protein LOC141614590 [Silene latifolia]|uniref:uncharacterized protein LOC141614590 n=1 Tax=Silene latifolia TaxID=37657 RepID=UPI003D779893
MACEDQRLDLGAIASVFGFEPGTLKLNGHFISVGVDFIAFQLLGFHYFLSFLKRVCLLVLILILLWLLMASLLSLVVNISLSNCQLEAIDISIKACTELEQLRLSHNEIKTLHYQKN